MKNGFGLLEVLISAVVLGFLIVGLNNLQKGNREGVLRVRARDAANSIAQEVIDSLAALGPASVQAGSYSIPKKREFDGGAGKLEMSYNIQFSVNDAPTSQTADETDYMKALALNPTLNKLSIKHQFAKQIDVTVSWTFKNSGQSINMSTVIR